MKRERKAFLITLLVLCSCTFLLFSEVDKEHYKNNYKMDKVYSQVDETMYWLSNHKDVDLHLSFKVDSAQGYGDKVTKYVIGGVELYTTYYKTNRYTLYIFPVESNAEHSIKGTKEKYNTVTRETIKYNPVYSGKDVSLGSNLVSEMEYGILEHSSGDSSTVLNNYTAYSLRVHDRLYNLMFISDDITVDEVVFTNTIVSTMSYLQ